MSGQRFLMYPQRRQICHHQLMSHPQIQVCLKIISRILIFLVLYWSIEKTLCGQAVLSVKSPSHSWPQKSQTHSSVWTYKIENIFKKIFLVIVNRRFCKTVACWSLVQLKNRETWHQNNLRDVLIASYSVDNDFFGISRLSVVKNQSRKS